MGIVSLEFEQCSIAHLGPLMLPAVRCGRPQRPWWEAARLHSMRHYLSEGDRLLDVGAEMGDMSALFASWGVDVFLVEPNPKAWPWIVQTFWANKLQQRVVGWYVGLLGGPDDEGGRDDGVICRWNRDMPTWAWPEYAALDPDPETGFHHLDEHAVVNEVWTVDELLADVGFVPTAITCDIEGGEIKMIEGMRETLTNHRPKVWMSIHDEFIADRYGIPYPAGHTLIDNFFIEYGYDPVFLAHDHERHVMYLPKEMGWRW